jgi:hypothetical protein
MTRALAAALLLATGIAVGCSDARGKGAAGGADEAEMTPLDRLVVGRAMEYPADLTMRAALPELRASQAARRAQAWAVARRVLAPVALDPAIDGGAARALPRFQTWYAKDEVLPMFDRILRAQSEAERRAHTAASRAAIDEAFAWEAGRARTLPGWTEQRLAQRLAELEADGTASLGGPERVLMSPALVGHLYAHYDRVLDCIGDVPGPADPPPSATSFAPCLGEEFPPGAAVVKARWIPDTLPLEAHDTSAEALSRTLTAGEWGPAARTASPDDRAIYTMRLPSGIRMRLAALHVVTKELRDWVWVTLFWSDTPNSDFGADRPVDFEAPFESYKMCSVVAYDEEDPGAETGSAPSLEAALAATRAFGPRTWCSNPYLEHGRGNAKTNCIGCHQHGGTGLTSSSVLEGPTAFPDGSRAKSRANFPADYLFVTSTGLELASLMKAKVDQLSAP